MTIFEPGRQKRHYDLGSPFSERMTYDVNGYIVYQGKAKPGSATSDPNWQIVRFTHDANGFTTEKNWAEGDNSFKYIWDNRATYTYS